MPIENLGHEHEFEPQFGLPERLPSDEFIVWQGSPDVGALTSSAFHIKKLMDQIILTIFDFNLKKSYLHYIKIKKLKKYLKNLN